MITRQEITVSIIIIFSLILFGFFINWSISKLIEIESQWIIFIIGVWLGVLSYGFKPRIQNFFDKCKIDDKDKKIYRDIYEELKDGIESLDGTLDRTTIQYEISGKNVNYKHIFMNHKIFDGYVNSGEFNHITHTLQQRIQDVYGKIEIHDNYVKEISKLSVDSNDESHTVLTLNQCEKELLKEIPKIMRDFKKYL